MRLVRVVRGLCVTGVLVTLWGCTPPLIPFSLDTPPVVLTPISFANITDGRARFREIYCAIRADHGIGLPEDLPCDDALVRLPGEPQSTGLPVNLPSVTRSLRVVVVPGIFDECIRRYVQTFSDGLAHLETSWLAHRVHTGQRTIRHGTQRIPDPRFRVGLVFSRGRTRALGGVLQGRRRYPGGSGPVSGDSPTRRGHGFRRRRHRGKSSRRRLRAPL